MVAHTKMAMNNSLFRVSSIIIIFFLKPLNLLETMYYR